MTMFIQNNTLTLSPDEQEMYNLLLIPQIETYPVDFDSLRKVLGFTRKSNAVRRLRSVCLQDTDYRMTPDAENRVNDKQRIDVFLTLNAARRFALESRAAERKKVINFFTKVLNFCTGDC